MIDVVDHGPDGRDDESDESVPDDGKRHGGPQYGGRGKEGERPTGRRGGIHEHADTEWQPHLTCSTRPHRPRRPTLLSLLTRPLSLSLTRSLTLTLPVPLRLPAVLCVSPGPARVAATAAAAVAAVAAVAALCCCCYCCRRRRRGGVPH